MAQPLPPRKTKADLQHPKAKRSRFNGDKWRGEKSKSFMSRVSTVEASAPQSNSKARSVGSVGDSKDVTGAIKPIPRGHAFTPALSNRQQRMIK